MSVAQATSLGFRAVAHEVRKGFARYASCWLLAIMSIVMGAKMFTGIIDDNFIETLHAITHVLSVQVLGIIWITFGILRMIALASICGVKPARWASYTRMIFSGMTTMFWLQLSLGALWAHPDATTAVIFPIFMAFDLFNTGDAASDLRSVK